MIILWLLRILGILGTSVLLSTQVLPFLSRFTNPNQPTIRDPFIVPNTRVSVVRRFTGGRRWVRY